MGLDGTITHGMQAAFAAQLLTDWLATRPKPGGWVMHAACASGHDAAGRYTDLSRRAGHAN